MRWPLVLLSFASIASARPSPPQSPDEVLERVQQTYAAHGDVSIDYTATFVLGPFRPRVELTGTFYASGLEHRWTSTNLQTGEREEQIETGTELWLVDHTHRTLWREHHESAPTPGAPLGLLPLVDPGWIGRNHFRKRLTIDGGHILVSLWQPAARLGLELEIDPTTWSIVRSTTHDCVGGDREDIYLLGVDLDAHLPASLFAVEVGDFPNYRVLTRSPFVDCSP